jgi:hypothetical protein
MALKPKGTSRASKPRKSATKSKSPPIEGAVLAWIIHELRRSFRFSPLCWLYGRPASAWWSERGLRGIPDTQRSWLRGSMLHRETHFCWRLQPKSDEQVLALKLD